MHVDRYDNYLLSVLLGLQLLGYVLFFTLWSKFGGKGVIFAMIVYFMLCSLVLHYMQKIKVYDDKGKEQKLSDILGDVFEITLWLIVSTIIFTIIGVFVGHHLANKYNRKHAIGMTIPIISVGVLLGSLTFIAKTEN